jgi:hypothetical protein
MPLPPFTTPTTTFTVSREQFDSVPRRRGFYIVAYGLYALCIYGPRLLRVVQIGIPDAWVLFTDIAGALAFCVFCYHFIGALKIMGYEVWMMLVLSLVAAIPIPGVLIVAYMDRRIATAWDRADPARGSYRQKPPTHE